MNMASPMQPFGDKLPPAPRAGFATGGEVEGGRAAARYVHTDSNISQAQAFSGTSREGERIRRRKRWEKLRGRIVNSLNRCAREKEAKALATCGDYYDVWARPTGEVKLLPCYCNSTFCVDCATRRARPVIKKLRKLVNRPGRSYWFLTLTVPNTENLSRLDISEISDRFAELWDSWVFQHDTRFSSSTWKVYGGGRLVGWVFKPAVKSWHPPITLVFVGGEK